MENSALRQGWDFMGKILGVQVSVDNSTNDYIYETEYNNQVRINNITIQQQNAEMDVRVNQINAEIDKLADTINNHPHVGNTVDTFKGLVAEEKHAATFNTDAIKKGSPYRAEVLHSNKYGSVDIRVKNGDVTIADYSLKYCDDYKNAENAQAVLSDNSSIPKYEHQKRLIAAEQVEKAKEIAARREVNNSITRPHVANAHYDTKKNLVGIIDENGVNSKELSIKESKQIAREAKEGKYDPEKHGIVKEKAEYIPKEEEIQINYINNALKAGLTAATITAITQIVPEFYKVIDYLIKNGEIDVNTLKDSGKKIITASGESFLRGAIAYGIEAAIQQGVLGEAVQALSPSVVGAMVTIVMSTIKNSLLVAAGKMTQKQMAVAFIDSVVLTSSCFVAMKLGGVIAQAIAPELPGLAYAIGSLIGCTIAVIYNIGKKKFISFCIETGFTCFGLVEQNYELPEGVLDELGIKTADVSRAQVSRTGVKASEVQPNVGRTNYETVKMTMVRRGIIDVNKIGYVIQ